MPPATQCHPQQTASERFKKCFNIREWEYPCPLSKHHDKHEHDRLTYT